MIRTIITPAAALSTQVDGYIKQSEENNRESVMADEPDIDEFEEIFDYVPQRTLEQAVQEGLVTPEQFRSMLLLMQTGVTFSTSPEDAIYIQKKIEELDREIAREKDQGSNADGSGDS